MTELGDYFYDVWTGLKLSWIPVLLGAVLATVMIVLIVRLNNRGRVKAEQQRQARQGDSSNHSDVSGS